MDHVVLAVLMLAIAIGLGYAGLRGVRGQAFWLPSAHYDSLDPAYMGMPVSQRYARPAGVAVLLAAVLLGGAAIVLLVHS